MFAQAPAASKANSGAAMPAASATGNEHATIGMEPVQKECWHIFNSPEAHGQENGISIDEVALICLFTSVLHA